MSDDRDDLIWRLGARHPGHDYRIFTTAFVDAMNPRTGAAKRFSLIECVDWVNVIALTTDDRVVLVRQYRAGSNTVCLEIPGGMVDGDEDPCTAAARELAEETGYTGGTWQLLGTVLPNPAIQNNRLFTVLALDVERTQEPDLDDGEHIEVSTATLAEIQTKLLTGEIDHALVVTAFGHLALRQCVLAPIEEP
jgi:8-oxo-dGTP pyrophosphatase MutT (NUDIX family)